MVQTLKREDVATTTHDEAVGRLPSVAKFARSENPYAEKEIPDAGGAAIWGAITGIPAMLTADEVAAILKCSARTVYRLVDSGRMPPPVRLGALARWHPSTIQAWMDAGCPPCRRSCAERESRN
jgi:excisionase family DNA binding protein